MNTPTRLAGLLALLIFLSCAILFADPEGKPDASGDGEKAETVKDAPFVLHADNYTFNEKTRWLKAEYKFSSEEEGLDWCTSLKTETGAWVSKVEDGVLVTRGFAQFALSSDGALDWIDLEKDVDITFDIRTTGPSSGIGARFFQDITGTQWYEILADLPVRDKRMQVIICYDQDRATKEGIWSCVEAHEIDSVITPGEWNSFNIKVKLGRVTFKFAPRKYLKCSNPSVRLSSGAISIGGYPPAKTEIDNIKIKAKVSKEWYRKHSRAKEIVRESEKEGHPAKDEGREPSVIALSENVKGVEKANAILVGVAEARTRGEILKLLDRAEKVSPGYALVPYTRAYVFYGYGLCDEAIEQFEKALKLCPGFYECYSGLASCMVYKKDLEKAAEYYDKQIKEAPDDDDLPLLERARFKIARGDFDAAAEDIEKAAAIAPDSSYLEYTRKLLAFHRDGPDWGDRYFKGKMHHYRVHTNISDAHARRMSIKLESAYKHFARQLPGIRAINELTEVYVFDTWQGFADINKQMGTQVPPGAVAYYNRYYNIIVMYDDLSDERSLCTALHECFHQFLHRSVGPSPIWFDEGCAEYFASFKYEKSGKKPELGSVTYYTRLGEIEARIASRRIVPLKDFMLLSHSQYTGEMYPQGWAMILFFMESGSYSTEFERYVAAVAEGKDPVECLEASFGALTEQGWGRLQSVWAAYINRLR